MTNGELIHPSDEAVLAETRRQFFGRAPEGSAPWRWRRY